MRNLLNPKWLFLVNTLPIIILFILFVGEFNIIKTLLQEENIQMWKTFGFVLGGFGLTNFVYALYLTLQKKEVSVFYGFAALLCYIPFIYLYTYSLEEIIPFDVPSWMIPNNLFLYVGTFLMPTLAYSLLILVSYFTSKKKEYQAWQSFLMAVLVPALWYLFIQVILPLRRPFDGDFNIHALIIILILGILLFLFFLIRAIFILAKNRTKTGKNYEILWKIPISLLFPLFGLAINNGFIFNSGNEGGLFGNFTNIWFYILTIINAVLICLPDAYNKSHRLILFIGKNITFTYTFYLFLVFLPFLPLSIIAIIVFGTGFLMLAPLALFVIHINELSKDYAYLTRWYSKSRIRTFIIAGILVLPVFVTVSYLNEKRVLNEALDYIYNPDYSKEYNINTASLDKTLNILKDHKEKDDFIFTNQIPYLSAYYNWLVLDNLTLSDAKISKIESVFFGTTSYDVDSERINNSNVAITDIAVNTTYDSAQKAWLSWIDFELTNSDSGGWFSEYATTINLPEGCWISDYYLYVEDRKEMGILSEKKSAMWVFSQIRNENKDPGILYYLTGNKVAFRVFPFSSGEVRKTGIQFLHKEPVQLLIDGNLVELETSDENLMADLETENVIYVSSEEKQSLQPVYRKPYYHFLINTSINQVENKEELSTRLEQFLEDNKDNTENCRISFVNTYTTSPFSIKDWKEQCQNQLFEGGFYLDRAIRSVLFHSYKTSSDSFPVIVIVTDIDNAILDKDFSDLKMTYPDNSYYFYLEEDGSLQPHSFIPDSFQLGNYLLQPVLEYKLADNSVVYLSDNQEPSIVLKKNIFDVSKDEIKEKDWKSALDLQGMWMSQILYPETSKKKWVDLVTYSFSSKIMTPLTSYIVVENEAQKAILKKKQSQVLSGNKSFDISDDVSRMSEPHLIFILILLGLFLWYQEKRKKKKAKV